MTSPKMLLPLALTLVLAGCPAVTPTTGMTGTMGAVATTVMNPDTAPVASIDRFSDSFGKLFKRTGPAFDPTNVSKVVPAPNAPIDFDQYFTVKGLGPAGEKITYYSLDIVPSAPAKGYKVVDASGNTIPNQLVIVESAPGDTGYNDFMKLTTVKVGSGYVANSLASADDVKAAAASGAVTLGDTSTIVNWALVPAGSIATKKFNGQAVTGYRAWYKRQVANYLRFDTALTANADGTVPNSPIVVIFANGKDPSTGFKADATGQTHNVLATLPGELPCCNALTS
jgi:hypothetical protein